MSRACGRTTGHSFRQVALSQQGPLLFLGYGRPKGHGHKSKFEFMCYWMPSVAGPLLYSCFHSVWKLKFKVWTSYLR